MQQGWNTINLSIHKLSVQRLLTAIKILKDYFTEALVAKNHPMEANQDQNKFHGKINRNSSLNPTGRMLVDRNTAVASVPQYSQIQMYHNSRN